MTRCGACAEENPPQAKFCLACGTKLDALQPVREVRKIVTIVFCDVTGSTNLGERLDPETLRRVMSRYFDEMRIALEDHGGTVEKFIGDAVMAVFGIPVLHEDDALRAVRAAADMQERLHALNQALIDEWGVQIRTRTGVNTGEVVAGDPSTGQALVTGDAVNVAARLEQAAEPGQVLLGENTFKLVKTAVEVDDAALLSLKGKELPVRAFALKRVTSSTRRDARIESPMLGRERERHLLLEAFERTLHEQRCHLFTILGAAGVGKSRLSQDVLSDLEKQDAQILIGRCLPYGKGNTFWPVQEVVKQAAGLSDTETLEQAREKILRLFDDEPEAASVAAIVEEAVGLRPPASPLDELHWSLRRLFETLAQRRPTVIVFDDIHWGESAFLDLIEHVADWSRDAPILMLCIARPDLLEMRPTWGGGKFNASTVLLEPLDDTDANDLIDNLLGGAGLDDAARAKIVAAAEGNPLFVEEMIGMMVDEGLLASVDGRWEPTQDLSRLTVPPSIQALLAARLDLLKADERLVVEAASVVGKEFYRGAVSELVDEKDRQRVGDHLMSLVRKELIRHERSQLVSQDAFRFRHILIRDAAYSSMSKETRAEMHERFADWLTSLVGERLPEFEEIVAHHLEQAYRLHAELGPLTERAKPLRERAIAALINVGRRARARDDVGAAVSVFARAAAIMDDTDARKTGVLRTLGVVQQLAGLTEEGQRNLGRAVELARATGDLVELGYCELVAGDAATAGAVVTSAQESERTATKWLAFYRERNDDTGLALAYSLLAGVDMVSCRWLRCLESAELALRHAAHADDHAVKMAMVHQLLGGHIFGPLHADESLRRLGELENDESVPATLRLYARLNTAPFYAMKGDIETARGLVAEARACYADRRNAVLLGSVSFMGGPVERYAGNLEGAVEEFLKGHELYLDIGSDSFRSTIDGWLALTLNALGRYDEGERYALEARDICPPGDAATEMSWRAAAAVPLAARGELDRAKQLAREAVELADATDFCNEKAEVLLAQADVYVMAGDPEAAQRCIERALELYAIKGNVAMTALVRPRLARVASS